MWCAEPGAYRSTQDCGVLEAAPLFKQTAISRQQTKNARLFAVAIESDRGGVQVDESIGLRRKLFRGGVCRNVKMHGHGQCRGAILRGQAAQHH